MPIKLSITYQLLKQYANKEINYQHMEKGENYQHSMQHIKAIDCQQSMQQLMLSISNT